MGMETNKFKRAWIWFWYNDATRFCFLLGLPLIPILLLVAYVFGPGEYLRTVAGITYIILFGWMLIDNDYSNLRRIGLDEYRKKLRVSKVVVYSPTSTSGTNTIIDKRSQ